MLSEEQEEICVDFAEEAEHAQVATLVACNHAISAVQDRLKQKGYLTCEECGKSIPEERRKAYPAARTCVPCQETIEKFYR